jgi:hypothetical protein
MTGIKAGLTAYRQEALVTIEELGWSEYEARMYRYNLNDLYSSNAVYKTLKQYNAIGVNRKIDQRLYKHIKGVYNPVNRYCEIYVSKVYGGELDLDKLEAGAFPVRNADDTLRALIRQQLIYANWRANKSLYVRQGNKFGDIFLKVVDDTQRGRTRVELLDPRMVKDFKKSGDGRIEQIIIEYERMHDDGAYRPNDNMKRSQQSYVYTEIITLDSITTFKDGKPFAYVDDGEGNPAVEWANDYGFVPITHVLNRDEGLEWGVTGFNAALDKIDELNNQASLLNTAVKKHVDTTWMMIGINKPDNKTVFASDESDDIKGLWIAGAQPSEVEAKPLIPDINIADALQNIAALQAELERDMPELAMHHLRDSSQQTAPGIRAAYNDAVDKFQEAQGIYDAGISEALQMSIAISGLRGYEGYQGYSADTYLNNGFEFYIAPRPVIEDELSRMEKITALTSSKAPARWIWKELGIADDEIELAEQEAEERRQEMLSFDIGNNPVTDNTDDNADTNNP